MTESLLISLAGAGLGIAAAFWSIGPLARLAPSNINVPLLSRVDVEPRVMLFSLALACLTTLFFGLLPMRQLFRDSVGVLSAGSVRAIGGRSRRRLRSSLVIGALLASSVLENQLVGVTARDPATYALLAAVLTGVALLASYLPALRATRVDPVVALRSE